MLDAVGILRELDPRVLMSVRYIRLLGGGMLGASHESLFVTEKSDNVLPPPELKYSERETPDSGGIDSDVAVVE